jgi:hypothetical protein
MGFGELFPIGSADTPSPQPLPAGEARLLLLQVLAGDPLHRSIRQLEHESPTVVAAHRRAIAARGWVVLVVRREDWEVLRSTAQKEQLLRSLLRDAVMQQGTA